MPQVFQGRENLVTGLTILLELHALHLDRDMPPKPWTRGPGACI